MQKRITFFFRENKIRYICCLITAVLLVAAGLFLAFSMHGKWEKGGMDSKGPFRYRFRHGDVLEVRVDTTNLPQGTFSVITQDDENIQTIDRGGRRKEHVYRIRVKNAAYEEWQLELYADQEAKENEEALYALTVSISRDQDGKLTVLSAVAEDIQPVSHVKTDTYEYQYQLTDKSGSVMHVEIKQPVESQWYCTYDENKVEVSDLFYGQDTVMTDITAATEKAFDTEISFYTTRYTEENAEEEGREVKDVEFRLHVKGKNGVITRVTHE